MPDVYRFQFAPSVPFREAQDTLNLALLAVQSLYGEARARLDARCTDDAEKRSVVIDAGTRAGQDFALLFAGYVRHEFPPGSCTVTRFERPTSG